MKKILYYGKVTIKQEQIYVVASDKGLVFVGSPEHPLEEISNWYPTEGLIKNQEKVTQYVSALEQYFSGEKKDFEISLDIKGTSFQKKVWKVLRTIPYGQTISYSAIAELIENPKAARAVGSAVGANPILFFIPCHRVVGKNGKLTGYRGGLNLKKNILQLESGDIHEFN